MEIDLEKYKSNPKTAYLAETFARLAKEEDEIRLLVEADAGMKDLSEEELRNITAQKEALLKQMEGIL